MIAPDTLETDPHTGNGGPATGSRVGRLTLRLVIALALFPIVPSSAFWLTFTIDRYWNLGPGWLEPIQFWVLSITVGVTLVSLCIWRACVVWTAGRCSGTVIAATVPIAQVLAWRPLWQAGCVSDDVLRIGQSLDMVALWVWGTVWLWWGWGGVRTATRRRLRMSESARRVVLSFGTIPLVVGTFLIVYTFFEDVMDEFDISQRAYGALIWLTALVLLMGAVGSGMACCSFRLRVCFYVAAAAVAGVAAVSLDSTTIEHDEAIWFSLSNLFAAALALLSWLLIWRPTVLWNGRSRRATTLASIALLAVALLSPVAADRLASAEWAGILFFMLPMTAWGGWMIATMRIWRFRASRLPDHVEECLRCRSCGYSLRGLYTTRCPECGEQPTLDELIAELVGVADA